MDIDKMLNITGNVAGPQQTAAPTPDQLRQHQKLAKAAQDFEALFIGTMLKQMRKSVTGDSPLFGGSQESKMYQEMMDDATAQQMSRTGSFGFARLLVKTLEPRQPAAAGPNTKPNTQQEGVDVAS